MSDHRNRLSPLLTDKDAAPDDVEADISLSNEGAVGVFVSGPLGALVRRVLAGTVKMALAAQTAAAQPVKLVAKPKPPAPNAGASQASGLLEGGKATGKKPFPAKPRRRRRRG